MEIGLYTFGELTPHWTDGKPISAQQRLLEILAAAKLADKAGLDVFAVGNITGSISRLPPLLSCWPRSRK